MDGFMLLKVLRSVSLVLVVLTTICYLYQAVYLFLPFLLKRKPHKAAKPNRYAILIAARNEEAVLPHLLDSIRAQDYPAELITTFVVADNCTDGTAQAAEAHGAKVFPRFNELQVGKGYAIHDLLAHIDATEGLDQFDAFLIFDADNLLQSDYISQINRICSDGYEAFCGYRNSKNFGDNWLSSGYGIWYLHESAHMNQSRMLLGTTCVVNGTGFGFTRQLLERMGGWNFFTLTEDVEFTTYCATHGICIGYCHDAVLFDEQPTQFRHSWKQRTRWAQGGLQVSLLYAGDQVRGLFRGGKTSYASFENSTLSLWGYAMAGLSSLSTLLVTFLAERWLGLFMALVLALASAYCSMLFMGGLILLTEWHRIHATTAQKIRSMFSFPLFMMSFVPIALTAVFRKSRWDPIPHTVAISAEEVARK